MASDPKLRVLPSGKLTRVFERGQPVLDQSGFYAVATALYTDKGTYYWDGAGQYGTRLRTVANENAGTAATLSAQGTDALRQVEQLGRIRTGYRAEAARRRPGSWVLRLFWQAPGKSSDPIELRV